ncbi:helix-turn-helix domain-containing protein [Pseudaminobacter soli (ex Li et al. 2025)]|nr:helix-turn-helix transcriptional regulator [Mesorhizobium soli]
MSDDWKKRLEEGIKAKDKTQRAVSLAAGMAPGYVNSLIKGGKDPTIDNLIKVCDAAGISLYYVLYGVEMSPETEEIIRLLESSKKKRDSLLQLLRATDTPETAE